MVNTWTNYFVVFIAVIHIWYFIMAMFRWNQGFAKDLLNFSPEDAKSVSGLARYQAMHSGLLGAGLVWSIILLTNPDNVVENDIGHYLRNFLLWGVAIVGILGGKFVNRYFYLIQAAPAVVALVFIWLRR